VDYILAIIALAIGAIGGFFVAHFKSKSETSRLEERNTNLDEQLAETESKLAQLQQEKDAQLKEEREKSADLDRQLAGLRSEYSSLQEKLSEQKGELAEMQEQLKVQFENLANKILDEKSEKFTKQNKESLDQLLNPLGEKLEAFKKKVEETHKDEVEARGSLKQELKQLMDLNKTMSEDAKNLTKALKGDSKAQGNWGEVILSSILEKSGLRKDEEYFTQQSETLDDGRRLQPDVVVKLPDEKFLIVDSKVSLTAFERFTSAEDDSKAQSALKEHVLSVRSHVKGLSQKNYPQIYADKTPDFVLLFIPVEPAFAAALQAEPDLYNEAFEKNIVIVSPSTLLATLFTINTIWKRDRQNKYALEIADRGGALYDKFVLFAESLEEVGQRIEQTQKSYEEAKSRLSEGSGNVIRQVEMLKELGAKATKQIPDSFKGKE
jgi:DNA recombination protein RmuC